MDHTSAASRIPHCPPYPSPAHRADRHVRRVDRRGHTEGGPHERGWLHRSPRARAPAPAGTCSRAVEHDRAPA
eukprot:5404778-Prymnesium_polylepis.1